jgi:hypothetical protein
MNGELRGIRKEEILAHFRISPLRKITKNVDRDIRQQVALELVPLSWM